MHGAAYMLMKSEAELRVRMHRWVSRTWIAVVLLFGAATVATLFVSPYLFEGILKNPLFWIFAILLMAGLIYVPIGSMSKKSGATFLASSVVIASMFGLAAVSLFPRLVPSITNLDYSLTIYNASSSQTTLYTMLIIAIVGMPFVIGYTISPHT